MGNQLDQFLDQKYINLETYKKDGTPIRTPVWFVIDDDLIYVITRDSTGKVKRLRNNHDVRIVSCSFKGEPKDEWIKAEAENIAGDEADKAIKLRKKKYGMSARLIVYLHHKRAILSSTLSK